MVPPRPSGSQTAHGAARKSGSIPFAQVHNFEALKARVLARLEDRFDPGASKRMPPSLLRQSIRTQVEQITDHEARGITRSDRDRLVEELLAELLGYGPLEELFRDAAVREIMVTGPHTVIVRRENSQWLPTSLKFRDEEHVRSALEKLAAHADPMGGLILSLHVFDLKLPNGFRAVAIIPPPALGQAATAAFVRTDTPSTAPAAETTSGPASGRFPVLPTASASAATVPAPGTITASPRPGSGLVNTPPPRTPGTDSAANSNDPLTRHRNKIVERLISKMARLGVYDLHQVEITELRKIVAAFVREYVTVEKIYLNETDQGRLMLEILTIMQR
jgi:hypothetical protein